jgi:hypothetical protein
MKSELILLAGDSWGVGEWGSYAREYDVTHSGITKYLTDAGHFVINLSQPGESNIKSATLIENFLRANKHISPSYIMVLQTEWIRDIHSIDAAILNNDLSLGYGELKNNIMFRFWSQLSQIYKKNNIPVYVIGGCSDTPWIDNVESSYPGLRIACQSVTNLLLQNNHRITDPIYSTFTNRQSFQVELVKKYLNTKDLELLLQDIDKGNERLDLWMKSKEFFWPDGCHPNRQGHQVLFEFLKTQIPGL